MLTFDEELPLSERCTRSPEMWYSFSKVTGPVNQTKNKKKKEREFMSSKSRVLLCIRKGITPVCISPETRELKQILGEQAFWKQLKAR